MSKTDFQQILKTSSICFQSKEMNWYNLSLQTTCQVLTNGRLLTKTDEGIRMEKVCLLKVRTKQVWSPLLEALWYRLFLCTTYFSLIVLWVHREGMKLCSNSEACLSSVASPPSSIQITQQRLGGKFVTKACKSSLDVDLFGAGSCACRVQLGWSMERASAAQTSWLGDLWACGWTHLGSKANGCKQTTS